VRAVAAEEVKHPLFARVFVRLMEAEEKAGGAENRAELVAGLSGRVVEVGCGHGLNFRHYPPEVTEVVGVEPEPYLRERALEAARSAAVPVRVVEGVAGSLPVEDGSCDAGVSSLVLCSVADQAAALAELHRAIRPGGELRFYEHVIAEGDGFARWQRIADRTFWPRIAGGCHSARDTLGAMERAGFEIERVRRFPFPPQPIPVPARPHTLGVARRI
jgi:SAM-dependent methyltransferase